MPDVLSESPKRAVRPPIKKMKIMRRMVDMMARVLRPIRFMHPVPKMATTKHQAFKIMFYESRKWLVGLNWKLVSEAKTYDFKLGC